MARETKSLAMQNGHTCFHAGRPMNESNPYPRASKSHGLFEEGYRRAQLAALKSTAAKEGGE